MHPVTSINEPVINRREGSGHPDPHSEEDRGSSIEGSALSGSGGGQAKASGNESQTSKVPALSDSQDLRAPALSDSQNLRAPALLDSRDLRAPALSDSQDLQASAFLCSQDSLDPLPLVKTEPCENSLRWITAPMGPESPGPSKSPAQQPNVTSLQKEVQEMFMLRRMLVCTLPKANAEPARMCGRSFMQKYSYLRHVCKMHKSYVNIYYCAFCWFTTTVPGTVKHHHVCSHPEHELPSIVLVSVNDHTNSMAISRCRQRLKHALSKQTDKIFYCPYCSFRAPILGEVRDHIGSQHPERQKLKILEFCEVIL